MYFIVEAQNSYYPGYPIEMRGMYYAARRLSAQLKSISEDTNYGCLQKVYSIWVCMGDVPDYEAGTVTLYETKGELNGKKKVALKMLQQGDTYEKVALCTDMPLETIKEWEQEALAAV